MTKFKLSPEQMRAAARGLHTALLACTDTAVLLALTTAARNIAYFIEHCDDDQLRALVASLESEDDE